MDNLLEVKNLTTQFVTEEGVIRAVNGVSFNVEVGKTLGIVGESGCGKSVTAQSILQILGPSGQVQGEILFHRSPDEVVDLAKLDPTGPKIRAIRGKEISMIFQEPMTSLCPVYTIGNQIMEGILLHQKTSKAAARQLAASMLRKVGIPNPESRLDAYPHQLSGGMRQRAMIAMALACHPRLLIADEPTTALDVTIQAQILDLMKELQEELGMSIMLITHDLGVIAEFSDYVMVMYLGHIVEASPVQEIFAHPMHPYTKALLQSIPRAGKKTRQKLATIKGSVPDAYNIPTGCPFHPRCTHFLPGVCDTRTLTSVEISPGHVVKCHLVRNGAHANAQ